MTGPAWDDEHGFACCGGYIEHRYRCPHRAWPATATPEVRRAAIRGDCTGPACAEIEDLILCGLDYRQRKRLAGILARVWDDGSKAGSPDQLSSGAADVKLAAVEAHCRKHAERVSLHCPDPGRPAEALVKAADILAIIAVPPG